MIQRGLRFGALIIFVFGMAAPGIAWAEEDSAPQHQTLEEWQEMMAETYGRKGPYVALSAIGLFPAQNEFANGVVVKNNVGVGWNLRVGLRTASWMSLEVLYERLSGFDVRALGTTRRANGYAWLLNGKGYFFSSSRVQPFLSVGAGMMSIQAKLTSRRSGFGMRFATGLDIHLTENIVATAEAGYGRGMGTQIKNFSYGVLGLGLGYRF